MIPRFCFHDKLSIAGNCRMCLVEIVKSPKPVIACSTRVVNGMEVYTNSLLVRQVREHIIEFLLINHPLDCPICDQGGECDLQDQTLIYGSDKGRFREIKRSVSDKHFGPFIKTVMTRCIHCTKCVRFIEEYGDMAEIGTLGRGGDTEIGLYSNSILTSEISGNIIDLCPVGALTSNPYAFKARPWELLSTESIDIVDSIGSNISIQTRGNEILRILPRRNDDINECWITNSIRFGYDAFKRQRLLMPYSLLCTQKIVPVSWGKAISSFCFNFKMISTVYPNRVSIFTGPSTDLETMFFINQFNTRLGIFNINTSSWLNSNSRTSFYSKTCLKEIEFISLFVIVGRDLKTELPILNMKFKKATHRHSPSHRHSSILYVGSTIRSNYKMQHLGVSSKSLLNIFYGKSFSCFSVKRTSTFTLFSSVYDSYTDAYFSSNPTIKCNSNMLLLNTGELNKFDINTQQHHRSLLHDLKKKESIFTYFLGLSSVRKLPCNYSFNVLQGTWFTEETIHFDLFLPSLSFTEGSINYYSNFYGIVQRTFPAVTSPGKSVHNSKIIAALLHSISFENLNYTSPIDYNNIKWLFSWKVPFVKRISNSNNFEFFSYFSTQQKLDSYYSIWSESFIFMSNKNKVLYNSSFFKTSPTLNKIGMFQNNSTNFINI